jgi:hypothetical protein
MSEAPCADQWTNLPAGDCGAWGKLPPAAGCDEWRTDGDWILVSAFWQDVDHYWRDVAFWRDEIINWVTT